MPDDYASIYPYRNGDIIVIGPQCFASADEQVICWKGVNYYQFPDMTDEAFPHYNDHPPLN